MKVIGIAGAGFAGAVLARELVEKGGYSVEIFEERNHIAGNCHTERDAKTDVMVHRYGPHIFNTSRDDVWQYVNRYSTFGPYINRVKAVTERGMFTLPINLLTINQFYGKTLSPKEAESFIHTLGDRSIQTPANFEEQALKMIGRDLYHCFFYGYTKKQWGVEPRDLPASILQRLPVRFNYDDNYYNQKYQGIPTEGYTEIVRKILDHPRIHVHLCSKFPKERTSRYTHVFYSGPLDSWFDYRLGRLQYRTLEFEQIWDKGDFQGNAVINYCEEKVPFTRITEHKHLTPWETHAETTYFREYSKLTTPADVPYYPLRLTHDKALLQRYVDLAKAEKGITFIGRLGTYRYLDMHMVIGESLDLAKVCLERGEQTAWPSFSAEPLPQAAPAPQSLKAAS
jgi:UDP-galactopyranose mutase